MFSSDLCLHEHIHAHMDRNKTPQTKIGSNNKAGGKKGKKLFCHTILEGLFNISWAHYFGPATGTVLRWHKQRQLWSREERGRRKRQGVHYSRHSVLLSTSPTSPHLLEFASSCFSMNNFSPWAD